MGQFIISIGREFGSGGHEIAEKIAKDLGVNLYDRNLLDEIASDEKIDVKTLEEYDEKPRNRIFSRKVNGDYTSIADNLAEIQFDYLREKAKSGESFVVVGRCAESIVNGYGTFVSIFVHGDRNDKIKRIMERYELSPAEAEYKMNKHDKSRRVYHNSHVSTKWGDIKTYDVCVNSSRLGIDGTVESLEEYIKRRIKA